MSITFAFKLKHESVLGHFTNLNKHIDSCSLCVKYNSLLSNLFKATSIKLHILFYFLFPYNISSLQPFSSKTKSNSLASIFFTLKVNELLKGAWILVDLSAVLGGMENCDFKFFAGSIIETP